MSEANAMDARDTTAAMNPDRERLTWEEIKARYPDEWVVLVDFEYIDPDDEDSDFRTALVLGHSKERNRALRETRPIRSGGYKEFEHRFTGREIPPFASLFQLLYGR